MAIKYGEIANCTIDEAVKKILSARQSKPFGNMTLNEIIADMGKGDKEIFGLYFFFLGEEVVYIGKTESWDLLNRSVQHLRLSGSRHSDNQRRDMVNSRVTFLTYDSSYQGDRWVWVPGLEPLFISYLQPKYNKQLKDRNVGEGFKNSNKKIDDWPDLRNG